MTNKIIHEWLHPEQCWHEYDPNRRAWIPKQGWVFTKYVDNKDANICIKCGQDAGIPLQVNDEPLVSTAIQIPDYENDFNAVREAELKAIEEFGRLKYGEALLDAIGAVDDPYLSCVTAPASVRASTIVRLLEGR